MIIYSKSNILFQVMVATPEGDPSLALINVLSPELRVKNVEYRGIGQCEQKPDKPVPPPKSPTNFSPIPRNQVDHINVTVGELLVFRVPDVRTHTYIILVGCTLQVYIIFTIIGYLLRS